MTGHLRVTCRQREKSAGKSSPSSSSGKSSGKGSTTSAIVVDRPVIDDLIALVETKVAVSVANVWTFEPSVLIFWWERKCPGCRGGTR